MKSVATHSGKFHADEVFAVAILQLIHPDLTVTRSRKEEDLAKADIVVDVGGVYDPEKNRFDHHQREGAGQRDNGIPYSSAGLIWKHFGRQLTTSEEAFTYLDEKIFQFIDAIDNGITPYEVTKAQPYTISTVIGLFNPSWDEKERSFDESFFEALELAKKILKRELKRISGAEKANKLVLQAIKQSPKDYIILEQYSPWTKTLLESGSEAKYVLFPSLDKQWRVQAVPITPQSFETKKPFPEQWRGQPQEQLAQITGIPDIIFCHRTGFMAATKTKESAIKLAELALAAPTGEQ